ncbi:MAG: hypothetical protein JW932_17925 [Deltaproteobacteria bacterium]|nr:hypothetical protein [Deltaproteobacteria bacterium]
MDWIRFCQESLKQAAEEIKRIFVTDKRSVELSVGWGGDMTLIADKVSEEIIIEKLRKCRVDVRLISEEQGEVVIGKMPRHTIFLDPLDGSFNFKQGLPYFGISMAVMDKDTHPVAAYVLEIFQGIGYFADESGAYKDGVKLQTSQRRHANHVLLEFQKGIEPEALGVISKTLLGARHVRAPGAVALDLCKVAEGTFDCLMSAGGARFLDVAAGIYILEKAGGIVTDFQGDSGIREGTELTTKNILACANKAIRDSVIGEK